MSEDRRQDDRRQGTERRQGDRRQGDRRQREKENGVSISLPLFITVIAVTAVVFITSLFIVICRYEKVVKKLEENEDTGDVSELVLPSGNIESIDLSNLTNNSGTSELDNTNPSEDNTTPVE